MIGTIIIVLLAFWLWDWLSNLGDSGSSRSPQTAEPVKNTTTTSQKTVVTELKPKPLTTLEQLSKDFSEIANVLKNNRVIAQEYPDAYIEEVRHAIECKRRGDYVASNNLYKNIYRKMGCCLYTDFALGWYKTLAAGGDILDALLVLNLAETEMKRVMPGQITEQTLHKLELLMCIEGINGFQLSKYLKSISGNSNYVFHESKLNVKCNSGRFLSEIESFKQANPKAYQKILQILLNSLRIQNSSFFR